METHLSLLVSTIGCYSAATTTTSLVGYIGCQSEAYYPASVQTCPMSRECRIDWHQLARSSCLAARRLVREGIVPTIDAARSALPFTKGKVEVFVRRYCHTDYFKLLAGHHGWSTDSLSETVDAVFATLVHTVRSAGALHSAL